MLWRSQMIETNKRLEDNLREFFSVKLETTFSLRNESLQQFY